MLEAIKKHVSQNIFIVFDLILNYYDAFEWKPKTLTYILLKTNNILMV